MTRGKTWNALLGTGLTLALVLAVLLLPGAPVLALGADSPLTTLETHTGNVEVTIDVAATGCSSSGSGSFSIAGIPPTAAIVKAWYWFAGYHTGGSGSATFAGNALGPKPPDAVDPAAGAGLDGPLYRFDVTSFVSGDGSFAFSYSDSGGAICGAALAIVYEDAALPPRTIVLNDGAEQIQYATTSTAFDGMGAGAGRLIIWTTVDDTGGTAERVDLNGATVLGPGNIFNQNQGQFTSLHDNIAVSVVAGTNTLDIVTDEDWIDLNVAILVGPPSAPPTEPMSVDRISGQFVRTRQGIQLKSFVFVKDEGGAPVVGAEVTAALDVPGVGTGIVKTATTNADGRATFKVLSRKPRGTWQLCVTGLDLEGYTYTGPDCQSWDY